MINDRLRERVANSSVRIKSVGEEREGEEDKFI